LLVVDLLSSVCFQALDAIDKVGDLAHIKYTKGSKGFSDQEEIQY
jgi:hypothetical protein